MSAKGPDDKFERVTLPVTLAQTADTKAAGQTRTPRRVFKRPIGILCAGEYRVLQALQLSEGGVVFSGDAPLKLKDQVVVSLCLPGGGVIVARGEISDVRGEKGRAAQHTLKFLPLSLQVRRSIRNYVTAKTQAEAELESGEAA